VEGFRILPQGLAKALADFQLSTPPGLAPIAQVPWMHAAQPPTRSPNRNSRLFQCLGHSFSKRSPKTTYHDEVSMGAPLAMDGQNPTGRGRGLEGQGLVETMAGEVQGLVASILHTLERIE
jgi:hypothetical protein